MITFGRGDIVAVGDLTLRHAIQRFYGIDHVPSTAEMRAIAAPWRPYGSLGANLLFAAELEPGKDPWVSARRTPSC